jgi:hypothetical protein
MTNKTKPRAIITTDLECDDMNSLIHLCLYLNEIDIDGIIYTSSQFHFNGDGVHTLGEVNPNYRCIGEAAYMTHIGYPHPDPEAKNLKSYRPFEEGWIESLWKKEYAKVYPNLKKNHPDFPSPERLLSITKYGNIAFEGDVREDTEGSNLIKEAILDKDERILYLLSWGGVNTIVRALLSIAEEYKSTEQWEDIYRLICKKVRILGVFDGVGQDNSYEDHAKALYPDIKILNTDFMYGGFMASVREQEDCIETFRSEWLKENIKYGHGELMSKYGLFGDGTYYEGEPEPFQYGTQLSLNWGFDMIPNITFKSYDFLGEGDSGTYVLLFDVGLRGLENGNYGTLLGRVFESGHKPQKGYDYFTGEEGNPNRFVRAYQEEWAARAEWCIKSFDECNHPPIVSVVHGDITAAAGEVVYLEGSASDPDGDGLRSHWFVYLEGSNYSGNAKDLRVWETMHYFTRFTIPNDAKPGDYFNLILEVQDDAPKPITRYAQVIVTVKEADDDQKDRTRKPNIRLLPGAE